MLYESYSANQVRELHMIFHIKSPVYCFNRTSYPKLQNIWVHKTRRLVSTQRHGVQGTEVSERIEGVCSPWMRWIVEKECRKAHQ